MEDLDLLLDICDNIAGKSFCPLGDAAVGPVQSSIEQFREEYEFHIREKRCMVRSLSEKALALVPEGLERIDSKSDQEDLV